MEEKRMYQTTTTTNPAQESSTSDIPIERLSVSPKDRPNFHTSGETFPIWGSEQPKFQKLSKDYTASDKVDVCVVGGGIAGLTAAYFLQKSGKNVILLEKDEIVSGESGRTTAHIQVAYDDRFYQVRDLLGLEIAKQVCQSQYDARDLIENIIKEEKIDCDYFRVPGYLVCEEGDPFSQAPDKEESLDKEAKACKELGAPAELVTTTPAKGYNKALRFQDCGQFHPVKYLYQLAKAFENRGGTIYTQTFVTKMKGGTKPYSGIVNTKDGFTVLCDHLIVATGTPVNDMVTFHTKQEAYRSYVICARVPKDAFKDKFLLWTSGETYKYVRLEANKDRKDCDYLIIGGADHKVGDHGNTIPSRYAYLEEWGRKNFPMIQSIDYKWSGEVYEPMDFLPYGGKNPGSGSANEYVITGDSGTGMTNQTASARLIADMILGKKNPWQEAFDPSRKPWKVPGEWIKGQMDVGKKLGDYVASGDVESEHDLKPNSGAVIKKHLKPVAIYRDDDEKKLYSYSAICTHMACVLRWNQSEKSFDCPCHGSRFGKRGEVLNGPANKNLDLISIEDLVVSSVSK
jgi:glycine/D-amino acid oxidase-like deaminating enzyme/nitrite reductase/ring-hydroxylating ferredoxin subunit